ncbi:MAG: hypothetical protein LQ342_007670 [Letrouitia transgressa]|nr:MAG: hypothetical protein LQ342_007670 [Letrouitia transgressa]
MEERYTVDQTHGNCTGFPRAFPAENAPETEYYSDQAWPWQGIFSTLDNAILGENHRVCNWLQENPVYDPASPATKVKPESTIFLQVQTNNHAHEWAERPSGHYKIYLAGPSGTQLTTFDQLTMDRVVFSAPANKYAHIIGEPIFGGYGGDTGYSWLPFKLVDPAGNYLLEGTYNFVWTYWWSTEKKVDYMIPSYTTSFDIVIDASAEDSGTLTDCIKNDCNCAASLVGNSSAPGAKDLTNPWPPYEGNYLFTNYDGDDPASDDGKRTFQPYFTNASAASEAPELVIKVTESIRSGTWTDERLLKPVGNVTIPSTVEDYPSMPAGGGDGLMITQKVVPMRIEGATPGESTCGAGNTTVLDGANGYPTPSEVESSGVPVSETTSSTVKPSTGVAGGEGSSHRRHRGRYGRRPQA